jgi:uncharacterized OB-fold protein
MSGRGTIVSWCTFERDYYYGALQMPHNAILVELEEGPWFLSNPDNFTWREATIGEPVSLKFRQCEDEAGTFSLPVFAKDRDT